MPAVSAAPRCAASTPLKNLSLASAVPLCAPVLQSAPPANGLFHSQERHCQELPAALVANDAECWGLTSMARASSAIGTPISRRRTALTLNSRVNLRRDSPMTQNPIRCILSLNWLSQKKGQVHP